MSTQEEGRIHTEAGTHYDWIVIGKFEDQVEGEEHAEIGIPEDQLREASRVLGINPETYPVEIAAQVLGSFVEGGMWMDEILRRERGVHVFISVGPQFLKLYNLNYHDAPAIYEPKANLIINDERIIAGSVGVQLDELVSCTLDTQQGGEAGSKLKELRYCYFLSGVHELAHMAYFARLPADNIMHTSASLHPFKAPPELYDAQDHEYHALRWALRAAQTLRMEPIIVAHFQKRIRKAEQIRASE